jgi:transposase InsO family protein
MKGATLLATLQTLGIVASFSRPAVGNDNPYSEWLFKTLKYRPDYPPLRPFADLAAVRRWMSDLVNGYNHEHRYPLLDASTTPCGPGWSAPQKAPGRSMRPPEPDIRNAGRGLFAIGNGSKSFT